MSIKCIYLILMLFPTVTFAADPQQLRVPAGVEKDLKTFEPSGAVFLPDLDGFLIVIDDTDKKSHPWLYLSDRAGNIRNETFEVSGLEKIADMESVSTDATGRLYVLSSLGLTKGKKQKEERGLFVRIRRAGAAFTSDGSINLRGLLIDAVKNSKSADLKLLQSRIEDELDVESHFIRDGNLYIGLKSPQIRPGVASILNLGPVDKLFAEGKLSDVQLWKNVDFRSVSKDEDLLSEILVHGEEIWMATTTENHDGRFWKFDEKSGKAALRRKFTGQRLEGLAYDSVNKKIFMVFDQAKDPALFTFESPN